MSYTDHTWTSGLQSVADSNTYIRDNFRYLYNGRHGILLTSSTGQTLSTSTPTKLTHQNAQFEAGGMTGAGNYSAGDLTIGRTGLYTLTANILCYGSGIWTVEIRQNGNVCALGEGQVIGASCSITMKLVAGDLITQYANTTSGASIPSGGFFPNLSVLEQQGP
jgi:hypothetical protein